MGHAETKWFGQKHHLAAQVTKAIYTQLQKKHRRLPL